MNVKKKNRDEIKIGVGISLPQWALRHIDDISNERGQSRSGVLAKIVTDYLHEAGLHPKKGK